MLCNNVSVKFIFYFVLTFDSWSIFKFSPETRRVIYTTNAIESLNAQFKRLNRNRSVFPTKSSLEKALFLSVEKISKKWTHPIRNWGSIFGELSIMFEERISY